MPLSVETNPIVENDETVTGVAEIVMLNVGLVVRPAYTALNVTVPLVVPVETLTVPLLNVTRPGPISMEYPVRPAVDTLKVAAFVVVIVA